MVCSPFRGSRLQANFQNQFCQGKGFCWLIFGDVFCLRVCFWREVPICFLVVASETPPKRDTVNRETLILCSYDFGLSDKFIVFDPQFPTRSHIAIFRKIFRSRGSYFVNDSVSRNRVDSDLCFSGFQCVFQGQTSTVERHTHFAAKVRRVGLSQGSSSTFVLQNVPKGWKVFFVFRDQ